MDAIRQWALSICVTLAGTAIFSFLFPNGNLQKVLKFAVSLFFLSSVFSPVILNFSLKDEIGVMGAGTVSAQGTLEETTKAQMLKLTESNIKEVICDKLKTIDVIPEKIDININIDDMDSISITSVGLTLKDSDMNKKSDILDLLKREVGEAELLFTE